MSNKNANLKEKLKQALSSTARVISEDFDNVISKNKDKNSDNFSFFEIDNLNTKNDFIKARAESDSSALKKKFSNDLIFKKNSPTNSSCKSLYKIAEKVRYETLGSKMLKGIEKNLIENYNQIISLKKKNQIKSKEDVPIIEAFELYMLKNFYNINLDSIATKMLEVWKKDFDKSIFHHIEFLKNNLENQNIYSSRFTKILQEMDIFESNNEEYPNEENQEENQENPSNENSLSSKTTAG